MLPKINQLNHVAINVSDLEKTVQFYRDIIGLEELPRPNFDFPGAWFRTGPGQELHIIAREEELQMPSKAIGHFALRTEDPLSYADWLRSKGVEFRGPKSRPDGATQIFLQDPDGHVIEITGDLPG